MAERSFNALAVTVTVSGPNMALERVGKYFPEGSADFGDNSACIILSLVKPSSLRRAMASLRTQPCNRIINSTSHLAYEVWDGPEAGKSKLIPLFESSHILSIKGHRGSLTDIRISACDEKTLGRTAVRVMRQLMLRASERVPGLGAHGAAISYNGKGIVIAGQSGAGKSTVALALASRSGADLMAADSIVFVRPRPHGEWTVSGIPVPWRLGDSTLDVVPGLARALEDDTPRFRGRRLIRGKHELLTEELSLMLDVGEQFSAPLRCIVVLSQDPLRAVTVRELTWGERYDALASTLFSPSDQFVATDWLGLSIPTRGQLFDRTVMLANHVRIFKATWPTHDSIPAVAPEIAARLGLRERGTEAPSSR